MTGVFAKGLVAVGRRATPASKRFANAVAKASPAVLVGTVLLTLLGAVGVVFAAIGGIAVLALVGFRKAIK